MQRPVLTWLSCLILSMFVSAQTSKQPSFSSYPATIEQVRVKSINFRSGRETRRFRTNLTESLLEGVNFAGHYNISQWGCGTACLDGAIIDTRTGKVYWPKELRGIYAASDEPIVYKADSRLLIFNGYPASEKEKSKGRYYYEWTGTKLRFIKFSPSIAS